MKYYSEITEKLYDTLEALQAEEEKIRTEAVAAEQREVERINAQIEINEAIENVKKLIREYTEKYGRFTYKDERNTSYPIVGPNPIIDALFGSF